VIPVVNVIGGGKPAKAQGDNKSGKPIAGAKGQAKQNPAPEKPESTPEQVAAEQQQRFAEMRAKLLGQDARVD
jgi:hypothetical protein